MPEMITIVDLAQCDEQTVEVLATITYEAFQENAPAWLPTIESAREEVLEALTPGRHARVILEGSRPVGWIGVITGEHVWEIHPIAVAVASQYKGYGQQLVAHIEEMARSSGALTLFAGTGDEVGTTNLFGHDIYRDPVAAIADIEATGRNPFEFWLRAGFKIVGLMPDAEGPGKPGIHLAKRIDRD